MSIEDEARAEEPFRMDAYYYGFDSTGVMEVDRILSAVARAGKAYHSTDQWAEDAYGEGSPENWIQSAANDAALEWQVSRKPEAAPSAPHDHTGQPKVWCETHKHTHIATIPRFTYLCKSCGFGQWYKPDAEAHEAACPGHETYEVEHVTRPIEAAPSDTDRELLAVGLAKYGPEWWTPDDIQHMVSNLTEEDAPDRGSIAHEMWAMGAWLKHPKCRNNPKRGNDADYENECAVCEQYLLVVADAILGLRPSQPVQVEVTEASVKILAKHMANAASDWNHDDCDDDDHSLEHSNWEAYTGDALRALSAALTPPPAVPAPKVIPGTRAALDGLGIRAQLKGVSDE